MWPSFHRLLSAQVDELGDGCFILTCLIYSIDSFWWGVCSLLCIGVLYAVHKYYVSQRHWFFNTISTLVGPLTEKESYYYICLNEWDIYKGDNSTKISGFTIWLPYWQITHLPYLRLHLHVYHFQVRNRLTTTLWNVYSFCNYITITNF